MPSFAKNPKFIIGTIFVVWLMYVIYANFQLSPIEIRLLPLIATLQLKVSAVIVGALIAGALITLVIQFLWRRRRSAKNGSQSAVAS